jgi:hypothetical protein
MKTSGHSQIEHRINQLKQGSLLFPPDFRGLGTDVAIKNALSRLAKAGKIQRLAQGLYYLPKNDPKLGTLLPSLEEIAEVIAKREDIKIRPAGAFALHRLGLSTQVPMKQVYITNGIPKRLKIGKGTIIFKTTTAKKLAMKGPISSLVIQALGELDPKDLQLDKQLNEKIRHLLSQENPELLLHDLKLAPAKISDFIYRSFLTKDFMNNIETHDRLVK